jgi:hypothetical protein
VVLAIYAVKWIGIILPFIMIISILVVKNSELSIKETVRLNSTTRSPLLSFLGETIQGSSTIRAFKRNEEFIKVNNQLLNDNILAV